MTHARIFQPPTPLPAALEQVDAWLESPSLMLLSEGDEHWPRLRPLVEAGRISGPQIHDARVAALSLAYGVRELWTVDRDFGRFPALATVNPLTAWRAPVFAPYARLLRAPCTSIRMFVSQAT